MRIEKLKIKKDGKTYEGEIVWPDGLKIAIHLLGEKEVWEAFKVGYKELAKKRITGELTRPRRKTVKIDVASLDDQTRLVIEEIARLQAAQPHERQALKNDEPQEPHTYPNGFDETPEEDSTSVFARETVSEEETTTHSDALGS